MNCLDCGTINSTRWKTIKTHIRCTKCYAIWYKANNGKEMAIIHKKYYKANKEKLRKYRKQYAINNRVLLSENSRKYKANRKKKDINFKLRENLRTRLYSAIKHDWKVGSAIEDLDCSVEKLKKHIEVQFQPGMSWDNWSKTGWHIDHIKPLASFNLTNRDEFKQACHYTNLQPLWAKDNLSKGTNYGREDQ